MAGGFRRWHRAMADGERGYVAGPEPARTVLLAPDEPPPFEILEAGRPGPVLLVCDHASRFIPRGLADLGLDRATLDRHVAWDPGAAAVTRLLAARLHAPAVLSHFSRLIIDPNRPLDDPESIREVSDGVEVPGNRGLGPAERQARADTFFFPYQNAIGARIDRIVHAGATPVVVSIHSFTPALAVGGGHRPWQVGILWDEDARLARPVIDLLRRRHGVAVGDNEPYTGRSPHAYTMPIHCYERGIPGVLFEIRQDLIAEPGGIAHWADIVGDVLERVLAEFHPDDKGADS